MHFHRHIDIKGALMNFRPHEWRRSLKRDDGTFLTFDEVKEHFLDQLAMGRRVIPVGKPCDGFDYAGKGCPGHKTPDEPAPDRDAEIEALAEKLLVAWHGDGTQASAEGAEGYPLHAFGWAEKFIDYRDKWREGRKEKKS